MRLVLARHGDVEETYVGCYNGHIDIALSDRGCERADQLAQKLFDERFDAVYCSTLRRARQTLEALGLDQKVRYLDTLREKSWGRHEGLSFDEVALMEDAEYESFHQWLQLLDGESVEGFIRRIEHFFFDFLPKQGHESVLVMTHAGVIRTFLHLYERIPLEEAFAQPIEYGDYRVIDFKEQV